MVVIDHQLDAARELGEIVVKLLDVGFVPASYGCPENADGYPILEEDNHYWNNLVEAKNILQQYGQVEISDEFSDLPNFEPTQISRTLQLDVESDSEASVWLNVDYQASGEAYIGGGIKPSKGPSVTVFDDFYSDLSAVTVGRTVARAELTILVSALGSSAETLDYWVLEETRFQSSEYDYGEEDEWVREFTQSNWADLRGVSRQAVSKQISSAKKKLQNTQ